MVSQLTMFSHKISFIKNKIILYSKFKHGIYSPSIHRYPTNTQDATGENDDDDDETILCWENTVLFLISCYQYLILGVVYSKGLPYRKPIYTNGNAFFSCHR